MIKEKSKFEQFSASVEKVKKKLVSLEEAKIVVISGEEDYLKYTCKKDLQDFCSHQGHTNYFVEESNQSSCDWEQLFSQKSLFEKSAVYFIKRLDSSNRLLSHLRQVKNLKHMQNTFIFHWNDNKIQATYKKELDRLGVDFIACPKLNTSEVRDLIRKHSKDLGLNLSNEAVGVWLDYFSNSLFELHNEMETLSLSLQNTTKRQVMGDDVLEHIGNIRQDHAFKLQDLLLQSRFSEVYLLISSLLQRQTNSLAILGVLSRFCRASYWLKHFEKSQSCQNQICRELKIPSFVFKRYSIFIRQYSLTQLKFAYRSCGKADQVLKTKYGACDALVLSEIVEKFYK
ncbi:MAG: hypothetical protein CMP11_02325 [Zetaproteobacteria bacterium]|nr:hypothetical protein [Pseudobdellovibrionaceae bacterium]|tara:strand:+ start:272 stop:1297 length:1026 start_codon:yes stop_codon:yes gene_type:complete